MSPRPLSLPWQFLAAPSPATLPGAVEGTDHPLLASLSRHDRLLWLLFLAAAWLLTTPYSGIWHDGNLYALQALHHLDPSAYAKELFFSFGSQDDFSLFSLPYAWMIRVLGLGTASMLMFCCCQVAWLAGAIRVFRALLPGATAFICVLLLIVTRHHYGGYGVFSYAEGFVTARLPAEALVLWSLAFIRGQRWRAGTIAASAAVLLHPLIGIWAFAAILGNALQPRRMAVAALAGSCIILLMVFFQAGPQSLIAGFDGAWLWLLHDGQVPYLFLDTWPAQDLQRTLFALLAIVLAASSVPGEVRRFWQTLALLAGFALGLGAVLGSVAHNVLITQLQPWRILWIVQALQWAALASALQARQIPLWPGLLVAALALSFISSNQHGASWPGWIALGGVLLLASMSSHHHSTTAANQSPAGWGKAGGWMRQISPLRPSLAILAIILLGWNWLGRLHAYLFDTSVFKGLVYFNVLPPGMVIVLAGLAMAGRRWARLLILVVTVLTLEMGLLFWDQRRPLEFAEMGCVGQPACSAPVTAMIPRGSMIFWEDRDGYSGAQSSWFYAAAATYVSGFQSSSRAFSRELSLEDERRRRLLNSIPERADIRQTPDAFSMDEAFARADRLDLKPPLDRAAIERLCQDEKLDYVVAYTKDSVAQPVPLPVTPVQFLHACAAFRESRIQAATPRSSGGTSAR